MRWPWASEPKPAGADHLSAVNFLNANLPVLHSLSASAVSKLRTENTKLFEEFHNTLLAVSSELNGVECGFEQKAKQLFAKEIAPQIHGIQEKWEKLESSGVAALATAGATLGLAMLSSPALPIALTMALSGLMGSGVVMSSIAEYRAGRRTPAFIWSKIAAGR